MNVIWCICCICLSSLIWLHERYMVLLLYLSSLILYCMNILWCFCFIYLSSLINKEDFYIRYVLVSIERIWIDCHVCCTGLSWECNSEIGEELCLWTIQSLKLKLKLCYDRWSVGQLASLLWYWASICGPWSDLFTVRPLRVGCPLWQEDELLGLASTVILRFETYRTFDHIVLSNLRLSQPGGPGPHIYIPQEQGGPVIPAYTGFIPHGHPCRRGL
jgi:hypothetical protein